MNLLKNPLKSSKEIYEGTEFGLSYATVKSELAKLVSEELITIEGKGKATEYIISKSYDLLHIIDVDQYFEKEIDERVIRDVFNFSITEELTFAIARNSKT